MNLDDPDRALLGIRQTARAHRRCDRERFSVAGKIL